MMKMMMMMMMMIMMILINDCDIILTMVTGIFFEMMKKYNNVYRSALSGYIIHKIDTNMNKTGMKIHVSGPENELTDAVF